MKTVKDTIWQRWQLIFLMLLVAMFPGVAFAHAGIEMFALYVGQYGLIMGIISGVIYSFIRVSHWYVISRSSGLYLIFLVAYSLYDITKGEGMFAWSDVALMAIITLAVGFVSGLIPLYFWHFAPCFLIERISRIFTR